ncbi:heterokaryon incompatibility protein [Apiospora marii]|uniref:Heterokaryon incompatibility protein n=1 Tax=Apiospora marii TaxID=335849 RepID=A0ABR1SJ37_9PEZI
MDNITAVQQKLDLSKNQIRMVELQPAPELGDRVVCRLVNVTLTDKLEFVALSSLLGDAPITTEYVTVNDRAIRIPTTIEQALRHVRAVFLPAISLNDPSPTSPTDDSTAHISIHSNGSGGNTNGITKTNTNYRDAWENLPPPPKREKTLPPARKPPGWLVQVLRNVKSILPDPSKSRRDREALKQTPNTLYVWIDALCVNRNSATESSGLLGHMGAVYRQAKMVIGWLGLKGPDTDLGVEGLALFEQALPPTFGEPGDEALHPENYAPRHDRPYFNRNWILDELALARYPAFLIGDRILSWNQVLAANRIAEEIRDHDSDVCPPEMKHLMHEWPLGTVYTLLREHEKRQRLERQQPGYSKTSSLSTTSSKSR